MTKEQNSRSLSNNTLLSATAHNIMCENDLNILLIQETDKEIINMTKKEIIENLFLLEKQSHIEYFVTKPVLKLIDLNLCNSQLYNIPNSLNMLKELQYLNLNNNCLSFLSDVICELHQLKKLYVSQNKLNQLPNNLGNLLNLEVLSLNTNHLTNLPDSCARLNKLEVLYLNDNKFKWIPNCISKGMKNLQILEFSCNINSKLDFYPLSTNLTTFYAEKNNVCLSFPKWILNSRYKKLEIVSLNETRFQTLNLPKKSSISYVKKLLMKQCNLSTEDIETIIIGMTNLEELIIGNGKVCYQNFFTTMPINTKKILSSLKIIDICNTGLSSIPEIINKFTNLSELNLGYNNIFFLPEEICSLKNLSRLIINNNHLTNLPENIGQLALLEELKLRHNYLNELPESIKLLHNLKYIDLYNNEFEIVPEIIFNLPNLKGLDFEQNYFSTECLWYTRCPNYKDMRDTLRHYWLDPIFGYESPCGSKVKSLTGSEKSFSSSSSSFDERLLCVLPEGSHNEIFDEHWDSSEDSADEFDPHENKEPKKRTFPPFTFYQPFEQIYRPADFHEDRIMTRVLKMLQNGTLVWLSNYEEGQFEDP